MKKLNGEIHGVYQDDPARDFRDSGNKIDQALVSILDARFSHDGFKCPHCGETHWAPPGVKDHRSRLYQFACWGCGQMFLLREEFTRHYFTSKVEDNPDAVV